MTAMKIYSLYLGDSKQANSQSYVAAVSCEVKGSFGALAGIEVGLVQTCGFA